MDIQSVDGLLQALETSSGTTADLIDILLNIGDLKKSWQALRQNAGSLPDTADLAEFYTDLQQVAKQAGPARGQSSSLLAAGAVRAGVQLGSTYIFNYYQDALQTIGKEGWTHYAWRVSKPYLVVAASHLDPKRVSFTESPGPSPETCRRIIMMDMLFVWPILYLFKNFTTCSWIAPDCNVSVTQSSGLNQLRAFPGFGNRIDYPRWV